jgi:hypothetical protein
MYPGEWTRWSSWFRHRATSQQVAGSIPDGVDGIFHWRNPSGCTGELTQPLTEMSARWFPEGWGGAGKGVRWVGLTTLPLSCAERQVKSRSPNVLESSGPILAYLTFYPGEKAYNVAQQIYIYSSAICSWCYQALPWNSAINIYCFIIRTLSFTLKEEFVSLVYQVRAVIFKLRTQN